VPLVTRRSFYHKLSFAVCRENASKSHDSKALQSSGMYNSSTNGLMPSSCLGSGGGNNVNDLDIDRLSSVSDIGDVSEINDLLEILHRQDSTSSGGGSGALNFDLLSSNPFGGLDDVTPLMQEVLRQSPVTVDRRLSTPTGGSMSRASALMPNNDQNGQTSDMQHSSGLCFTVYNISTKYMGVWLRPEFRIFSC
jgi:hypothetical protein